MSSKPSLPKWLGVVLFIGIVLAALNLRPAVVSLGPLLNLVIDDLQMSGFVAGLLTSAPAVCFALFGALAPRLAKRRGPELVVLAAMLAITLGVLLRSLAPTTALFLLLSALALSGIAVANVLMPVLVKRWFPHRIGLVTGAYSVALAIGSSLIAGVAVPLNNALGGHWRLGLGAWAVPAAVAVVVWVVLNLGLRPHIQAQRDAELVTAADIQGEIVIWRSPTAWWLAIFFGLQASMAYINMGWMAKIFTDFGLGADRAGWLLAIIMGVSVPLSFFIPTTAARFAHQGPIVLLLGISGLVGIAGLLLAPVSGALLWALLLGFSGCTFSLTLTMIGLKARTTAGVVKLSAFTQSVGYLISIPGPLVVGALHETTGSWNGPIMFMGGILLLLCVAGYMAGRPRYVEGDLHGELEEVTAR
ncbi:MFS transporter [Glutamicibacter sp. PS]|uniref:MFS transporter n=1 Tax=Glutamicibacter sp. PS TaxID=3075634 RepID=UPI00283AF2D3|nr:MFS transporter [Glutamicibacter sp. PS]MDR4534352.1 MFS transporter [Glutamicibacter sp. PS]